MNMASDSSSGTLKRKNNDDSTGFSQVHPSKTARPSGQNLPQPIPTSNRFNVLASNDTQENDGAVPSTSGTNKTSHKSKYFAPIVAHVEVTPEFTNLLTKTIQKEKEYLLEYFPNGIKIRTTNITDFENVKKFLENKNIEYFDYGVDTLKTIKYVIRGLPLSTSYDDVHRNLLLHNVTPSQLRQLSKTVYNAETNKRETVTIPLWVVTIEKKNEAIAALKAIAAIDHIKIRFEDYKGRSNVQQCYRCLHFGHKANQCQMKYRCLRCAEGHDTRQCPKSETALPKCANCGEAHKQIIKNVQKLLPINKI